MKNGTIEAFSDVGDYIGSGMINGKITVHSKAGKSAGINMQGGLIELKSDTGDELGMELNGGHIIVYGKSGKNVGYNRKFGIIELLGGYESIGYTASGSEAQIHTG
jgi:formylmethanofuran dehydrogenase subunit C